MVDLKAIRKELLRLSGLSFQPTAPEGWTELAMVLQRRCLTMDHVQRVLSRWLETEENVPKPSQLGSLCSDVPADPTMDHPILQAPCDECAPEGLWRSVQRLDRFGQVVDYLVRCACARGKQLASLDAKRAAEASGKDRKQPNSIRRLASSDMEETG